MEIKLFEEFVNPVSDEIKQEYVEKAFDVWERFCKQHEGKYYNANEDQSHIVDQVRLNKFVFNWEINNGKITMNINPIDINGGNDTWFLFDDKNEKMKDLTLSLYLLNK